MRRIPFNSESGVILPIVIILMLALTITGIAFLNAGVMENSLVRREIYKNQAFYLAEAGVEDARFKLGQDWDDLGPIELTDLGAGTYKAHIYDTDVNLDPFDPDIRRRVKSTGTVSEISKGVEVILRKPPTGGLINSALRAGGDIVIIGSGEVVPPPSEEPGVDKFVDFVAGDDPVDIDPYGKLTLFEETFGVTWEYMRDIICRRDPNIHYDSSIKNVDVENMTWVDSTLGETEFTTEGWAGSGILIVEGDLKITGGSFRGIIWVTGSLWIGAGSPVIEGTVFVECDTVVDTIIKGNAMIKYDPDAIDDAFDELATLAIVEFWRELRAEELL